MAEDKKCLYDKIKAVFRIFAFLFVPLCVDFSFSFMKHDMKGQKVGQWTSDEVHLAVLAIESAAKKMDISPMEMQRRLK